MDDEFSGEEFRQRRKAAGLTYVDVAVAVGLPSPYIRRIEEGTAIPSPEAVARLEAMLCQAEVGTSHP